MMVLASGGTSAVAQTYPQDSPIPGCAIYFDHYYLNALGEYAPAHRSWCGSDELGWYTTDEWCAYFGYCWQDYTNHE